MPVNEELDATPEFTLSTIQFDDETVNVIITSTLAVFIVCNIGSVISKLVYYTHRTNFRYSSWTRAFIYSNSDDPIKIISWLSRKYLYRDKRWKRQHNKLKLQRLILPLLARFVMVLCSIASVAVALPGEKKIPGCESGDFGVVFNRSAPIIEKRTAGVCTTIPIISRRGRVDSRAQYCDFPANFDTDSSFSRWSVVAQHSPREGTIKSFLETDSKFDGFESSIEWEDNTYTDITLRTNLSQAITLEGHLSTLTRVMTAFEFSCEVFMKPTIISSSLSVQWLSCPKPFLKRDAISKMRGVIQESLHWKKRPKRQHRIKVIADGRTAPTNKCPFDIIIQRPLVNIVPLAIAFMACLIVNAFTSCVLSRGGNALDAAYHIINEVLGHDSTSNPLEENAERYEFTDLDLRNWHCSDGGAHVGFIGRSGDTPVDEFREGTVVCACARGTSELKNSKVLCGRVPASYENPPSPIVSNNAGPTFGASSVGGL